MSLKPLFSILLAGVTLMATEEPKYKVVEKWVELKFGSTSPIWLHKLK